MDMSNGSSDNDSDADMDALFMGAAVTATVAVATLTQRMMAAVPALPEERTPRPPAAYRHRAHWAATPWMRMLTEQAGELQQPQSRAAKRFRGDFRLPYPVFLRVVEAAKAHKWLWCCDTDAVGVKSAPLELKVLAVLYLLGSGAALRTIASLSGMSQTTVQRVLHAFCSDFAADMYDEWVKPELNEETYRPLMQHYAAVGFPGCVGSSDVTHVPWDKTPSRSLRAYTGKEGFPTVAYEVTVSHTMQVLGVTAGFQGSFNDKTIVRYDAGVQRVKTDPFFTRMEYSVRIGAGNEASSYKRITGAYIAVDGGYHKVRGLFGSTRMHLSDACAMSVRMSEFGCL